VIAVAGEALLDAHLDGDVLRVFPGGGPFNTAIALARLGAPVCYLGAISRDRLGRRLEQKLRSAGVDLSRTARVDAPTPIAIVDGEKADPSYSFYFAGTAHEALVREHLQDLPGKITALHVGTLALATDPPGSVVAAFAEREAGRRVLVLDPNVRPSLMPDRDAYLQRFERLVAVADLVKLSHADLAWLYPGADPDELGRRLLAMGTGCVIVTHGSEGAAGWTRSASARVRAPAVAIVDTVGAGDAFGAGLLDWLWRSKRLSKQRLRRLQSGELEAALAHASAAGAAQCTRASAWGPTAADVERLLEEARDVIGRGHPENERQASSST
jgi:fructokinase